MITNIEIKELTAIQEFKSKVNLTIAEMMNGQFDVFVLPTQWGHQGVRVTKIGNKEDIVAEALKEFEVKNNVKLGLKMPYLLLMLGFLLLEFILGSKLILNVG